MTSPPPARPRPGARARRPSLPATVLRVTSAALVATVLVWSALFANSLRTGGEPAAVLAQPFDRSAGPDDQSDTAPAPATTHAS
jgi:hypothetical protein